jgi:hypothetical protein
LPVAGQPVRKGEVLAWVVPSAGQIERSNQAAQLAELAGNAVGRLHRAGFRHGCLYGKHLMARHIDSAPEIAFIDLEKLRFALFKRRSIRHDLEQLQRRQHIWDSTQWLIFLAAHERALRGRSNAPAKVY